MTDIAIAEALNEIAKALNRIADMMTPEIRGRLENEWNEKRLRAMSHPDAPPPSSPPPGSPAGVSGDV